MLGWLPIIGPIFNAITNMFAKAEDTTLGLGAQKTELAIETGNQDVSVIQTRANVAVAFKDDPGVKFARDILLNWGTCYYGLIFYYSCFHTLIPQYTWVILRVPPALEYLLSAMIAFLFVTAWRGK